MTTSSITNPILNSPYLSRGMYPQDTGSNISSTGELLNGANPGTVNNPNFNAQVTIEEQHHDEMEIVVHPIEQGAPITDHSFKKPAELTLHIGWTGPQSDVPYDSGQGAYQSALANIYSQLLLGQSNRVLYTVVTGKRSYQNMLIKGLAVMTDKTTENMLEVTVQLQELLLVQTQTTSVPAPAAAQRFAGITNPSTNQGTQYAGLGQNFNEPAFTTLDALGETGLVMTP